MRDNGPKIEITNEKVELLVRSALLEDASNINERFAAIKADIKLVDHVIWITVDDDLWPDNKSACHTETLAKMLWLEIDWAATIGTFPFAWPGLGEFTESTSEYFGMVLDAHAGREIKRK